MSNSDDIKIIFAGDFIPPMINSDVFSDELYAILKDKDFSIVNLEAPIASNYNKIRTYKKTLHTSEAAINHLKNGYFDAVALSNNHICDYGKEGLLNTLNTCEREDIQTVGAGKDISEASKPLQVQLRNKKVTLLNYCENELNIATRHIAGANPFNHIKAYNELRAYKEDCDYIIVIYHGGLEYHKYPLPGIKENLEFMVECGADAVICHHTHYKSGYEIYNGKPIFFGLGNFYYVSKSRTHIKNPELHSGLLITLLLNDDAVKFKYDFIQKTEDQQTLSVVTDQLKLTQMRNEVNEINKIINSEELFSLYWNSQQESYQKDYYIAIFGKNRLLKIALRMALRIFPAYVSKIHTKKLLNLFSCDSHREMIIRSLDNKWKNKT